MQPWVRAVRLSIVGVWATLLVALVSSRLPHPDEQAPSVAPAPLAAADDAGEDLWSGIYMNGSKIGYGHYRSTPAAGGDRRVEEMSLLKLTVLDREQTVRATIDADAAPDLSMRRFDVALTSDLGTFAARGTVADGQLTLDVTTGGQTTTQRVPLDQPLYLPAARARLSAGELREGTSLTLQVFDATAMQHQPMTLRVIGRETLTENGASVPTWKVHESFRGMESDVWLDDAGDTVLERGPMGLELRRESPGDAVAKGWSGARST
jgi:hypothetical protein